MPVCSAGGCGSGKNKKKKKEKNLKLRAFGVLRNACVLGGGVREWDSELGWAVGCDGA